MSAARLLPARLVAVFVLGWVGFNAPLLHVVSRRTSLFGLPLPFLYLFAVWSLLILLIALVIRPRRGE